MSAIPLSECKFCPHCGTPKERWPAAIYEFTPEAAPPGPRPPRKPRASRKKPAAAPNGAASPGEAPAAAVPGASEASPLSPAVQEIADSYPKVLDADLVWQRATIAIHALLKSGVAQTALVRAATLYRRQQAALGNVGTARVMSPDVFFEGDTWQQRFEMPVDPLVLEAEKETQLTNEQWLASGYAKR